MNFPPADLVVHDYLIEVTSAGRWLLVAWLTVVGGAFGSFMNVVVYRLPRKLNLSYPGSRCPACEHPIRWHDNVPVLGWLALGGRCRDCGVRISPRYPLVEALVAATAGLLAWAHFTPLVEMLDDTRLLVFDPLGFAAALLLSCTLICAGLMELDGVVPPPRLYVGIIIVGLAARLLGPTVSHQAAADFSSVLAGTAAALASAVLLGLLAWPAWIEDTSRAGWRLGLARGALFVLVAIYLGSRAVVVVAVLAMVLLLVGQIVAFGWLQARRMGVGASLFLAVLVQQTLGRGDFSNWPPLAEADTLKLLLAGGAIVAVLALVIRVARSRRTSTYVA